MADLLRFLTNPHTHMRQLLRPFGVICALALTMSACKKNTNSINPDQPSPETLAKISHLGFSTDGVTKTQNGYLVEGDILLSEAELNAQPQSPNMIIAQEEQYRTFNLVSVSRHPVIKVALNNSSTQHEAAFSAALDEAISRYNAQGLTISFTRVAANQSPDITVVAFYQVSNTLGSSGFPNSTGDPYNQVQMNTYWYSTGTDVTNVNYIGTIMS